MSNDMHRAATDVVENWHLAREVIAAWVGELLPQVDAVSAYRAAEALLARLASNDPALLLLRVEALMETPHDIRDTA